MSFHLQFIYCSAVLLGTTVICSGQEASVWLDRLALGHTTARPIKGASITGVKVNDCTFQLISEVPDFRAIQVDSTVESNLTGLGIEYICTQKNLQFLALTGCSVTGRNLVPVRSLSRLEFLKLNGPTTDADLAGLNTLHRLTFLSLYSTPIDGSGFAGWTSQSSLSTLQLDLTRYSDANLAHLENFPALTTLYLRGTPITDAGMKHIAANSQLEVLYLDGTAVTNLGLQELLVVPSLPDQPLPAGLISLTDLSLRCMPGVRADSHLANLANLVGCNDRLSKIHLQCSGITSSQLSQLEFAWKEAKVWHSRNAWVKFKHFPSGFEIVGLYFIDLPAGLSVDHADLPPSGPPFNDVWLTYAGSLTRLEELSFYNVAAFDRFYLNAITVAVANGSLPSLQRIDLRGTDLSPMVQEDYDAIEALKAVFSGTVFGP